METDPQPDLGTHTPEPMPLGMAGRYRTAVKVVIAALALGALAWVVVATGVLSPRPATYVAVWDTAAVGLEPEVSPDGRSVTVHYMGGACDEDAVAQVDESQTLVKITIVVTETGGDCPSVGVGRSISFELDGPLGSRRLVDGSRTS